MAMDLFGYTIAVFYVKIACDLFPFSDINRMLPRKSRLTAKAIEARV